MVRKAGYPLSLIFSVLLILSGCSGATDTYSGGPPPAPPPVTGSALVTWTAPVSRLNGDPISLSEIGGYIVYFGTSSGNLTNAVTVAGGSTNQRQITGLAPGTYYFQVSAYDQQGAEGPRSGLVSKVIQ